jgi:uroporphyrinogen-III synthase
LAPPLQHLRIALLETQLAEEAVRLVEQFGGVPYRVPAARHAVHLDRVGPFIDRLSSGLISTVVLLTGLGAATLLREASRLGRLDETVAALRKTTTACRGPKPAAVLAAHGIPITIAVAAPFTTGELIEALAPLDMTNQAVAVVHHGAVHHQAGGHGRVDHRSPNLALASVLAARGARVDELSLYEWVLPEDLEPLRQLVRELIEGGVDAIAFTNRVQTRHLFRVAADLGFTAALTDALNRDVIVAAVGPVCADALQLLDVTPDVMPARPTMEAMIAALADYVELTTDLENDAAT